ncbi:MAG: hypothetical protein GY947_13485 [Rhodobacteraceae bacterium]|nr:hypothetical protein [Paracoccaceae bacterium]
MPRLALLVTVFALAGLAYSGWQLSETVQQQRAEGQVAALTKPDPVQSAALENPTENIRWPALFGVYQKTPPKPPEPKQPPIQISKNYRLKGFIANGDGGWAIVQDGSGEYMLRVGDQLVEGATVVEINKTGVVLETDNGIEVIEFEE